MPYVLLPFVWAYSYMMRGISKIKPAVCLITQTGTSNAWLQSLMQRALPSVMGFSLSQLRWIELSYAILLMKAMNRSSVLRTEEIMDRANTLVQCSYYSKTELWNVFEVLNMILVIDSLIMRSEFTVEGMLDLHDLIVHQFHMNK